MKNKTTQNKKALAPKWNVQHLHLIAMAGLFGLVNS